MGDAIGICNATAVAALAAITGQTVDGATEMFCGIVESAPDHTVAGRSDIDGAVNRLCTRVGLAPALDKAERERHIGALRALTADDVTALSYGDLHAWDAILRSVPERIPTVDREPVLLPDMPAHQAAMWSTLLGFEGR